MDTEYLERLYSVVPWAEDPSDKNFRLRYEKLVNGFRKALDHELVKHIFQKDRIRILDLCGGTGVGAVSFVKALDGRLKVEPWVVDLRRQALETAVKWSSAEIGEPVRTAVMDVLKVHELGLKFDVAIMVGYSATHFDPWSMIRIIASVSTLLEDDGVFILEEADRLKVVFLSKGYRSFLVEKAEEDSLVVSAHSKYDMVSGVFTRVIVDLVKGRSSNIRVYFWSLSQLLSLLWLFFRDTDYIGLTPNYGLIVARGPRKRFKIEDFKEDPPFLRQT